MTSSRMPQESIARAAVALRGADYASWTEFTTALADWETALTRECVRAPTGDVFRQLQGRAQMLGDLTKTLENAPETMQKLRERQDRP